MKPSVKISGTVVKRLAKAKEPCFGKLYGIFFKDTLTVVGLQVYIQDGADLVHSYPAEVDFCGVFQIYNEDFNESQIKQYVHEIDVTDNPIFIACKLSGLQNEISVNIVTNGHIQKIHYVTNGEQDIYSNFVHIRLKGEVPFKCELNIKSVEEACQNIRRGLSSGIVIFTIPKTNVFLLGNQHENNVIGISGQPSVIDICEDSNDANEGAVRKNKSKHFELQILDITMLKRITKDGSSISGKEHAPLCILEKKPLRALNTTAIIDSLAMIHQETKVSDLYEILLECIIRHLRLFERNLISQIGASEYFTNTSLLQTFHFYPTECGHFLTRLYPKNESDTALKYQRQLLHSQLLLDEMSPVFRRANQYKFRSEINNSTPLINPHEGVKPTENGGQIALVRGKYEYYHYCQDKMDDSGWGCAYRSLQTLASWYILQGYTEKEVPTFKDIQKCLVDIGDKPSSFLGSKQWIGSTEVSFVLNTLLGITCKILYVSSGEEMGSKGPELVAHFENHGSPIMIGGGVYAHTILGVDYNHLTGNIRFLILDPHYTGAEELHVIQSKGWCGWKNVDFWEKSAYYNMCMPQISREEIGRLTGWYIVSEVNDAIVK